VQVVAGSVPCAQLLEPEPLIAMLSLNPVNPAGNTKPGYASEIGRAANVDQRLITVSSVVDAIGERSSPMRHPRFVGGLA
jgi:hypothetical protein